MSHDEYANLLKTLRDTPDEPTGVSIDRAVHEGRRTIRRRRIAGAAAIVALIAAVSSTPFVLDAIRPDKPAPIGPVQTTFKPFNLWSRSFDVASTGGFTPRRYITARRWQSVVLMPAKGSGLAGDAAAVATMYAPGAYPGVVSGTRLKDVGGRPAYLTPREGQLQIAWQYSGNAWGTVVVDGTQATLDRARKVAEGIQLRSRPVPVTVPFRIDRTTLGESDVVAVSTSQGDRADARHAFVSLGTGVPRVPEDVDELPRVGAGRPALPIETTTTIGGHRASVSPTQVTLLLGGNWEGYVQDVDHATAVAATFRLVPGGTNEPVR